MSDPWLVAGITVALIILSAFFVIIEFALLGARRHRLEEQAGESRSARAALRGMNELTVMLAGAQLGITAVTFALGAVTKPAVHHALMPLFSPWTPGWLADVISFILALFVVTFLHLVVGEMAPKSWAIAHPETSAKAISIPARAFVWLFRPLLNWINRLANRLVAASGVEPVDQAAVRGYDPATISQLVSHSRDTGALEDTFSTPLSGALELQTLAIGELVDPDNELTFVPPGSRAADVRARSLESGHLRVLVMDGIRDASPEVIHVRDTLMLPPDSGIGDVSRPVLKLDSQMLVHESLIELRDRSEQLAVVTHDGAITGVVTLADVLEHILPMNVSSDDTEIRN